MQPFTYRDGSANAYHFHGDGRFEYEPVTPARSSTGLYSGGDPRTGLLDEATRAALWQHVTALEGNARIRVADRGKGTGQFDIAGQRTFIVARGPELAAFDAFVGALR